jgi:serine phosphatase RsbU (regulator of sigma subunit)
MKIQNEAFLSMNDKRNASGVSNRIRKIFNEKVKHRENLALEKYKEIRSSISYAKNIQDVILPKDSVLSELLSHHFVINSPKDLLSGDFYWSSRVDEKTVIIVADSTGHGIPGSFMSMLGNVILHFTVNEKKITSPEEILFNVHKELRVLLRQYDENSTVPDGIEMAVCIIDRSAGLIEFAGANRPLLIVSNQGVTNEIAGDKYGIGGKVLGKERVYTKHQLPISEGTHYYMYTDGMQDQFGGADDKKLGSRQLKRMLVELRSDNLYHQKQNIQDAFQLWKGDNDQTDDILLFGFKM